MKQKDTFLITGAAGFIGAALTHALVREGHQPHVWVMGLKSNWRLANLEKHIHVHEVDIRYKEQVERAINAIRPTIIYHCAAHGAYPKQTDFTRMMETNVLGTEHLLSALQNHPYRLLVNTGSSSEYGFSSKAMHEDDRLNPNSPYAISKGAQTHLCQWWSKAYDKPIVTLRLFSIYGPLEEPTRLIPTIIHKAMRQEEIPMAQPETARDFVFIDDLIRLYRLTEPLIKAKGEIFNAASGHQTSLEETMTELKTVAGQALDVRWGAYPDRIWDTAKWMGAADKAKNMLGWTAKTTLREGLEKTWTWTKDHENALSQQ